MTQRTTGPADPARPPGRARLVDVAEQSGVSKAVVSRLLNGDTTLRLRDETRERILDVADQLGYRPHAGARSLSVARTGVLAVLVPDLMNPAYAAIVRGAYRRALDLDHVLLVMEDLDSGLAPPDYVGLVATGRVDGLIVGSARPGHPLVDRLVEQPTLLPHVFVNREVEGSARNVAFDLEAASALAVDHLRALGHERIGMVSGPAGLSPAADRLRGFRRRMKETGLVEAWHASADFTEAGGAQAASALLGRHPDVTAVYASSLRQAVGLLRVARETGRRIPDDLSVVSYDDLPLAGYLDPPLTTIRMPVAELGAAAVDAVVGQIAGGEPHAVRIVEGPALVVRDSTAPPR